ncbi:NAD(P)/FAD-dependent oxidoreductase [Arsenicibacter rosenii]|uniref:FAD-dependent oxidoreductase n=1 Tax=Arsenicibacter rosenii TaxID=1750698 RepID=A0A1S2VKK8_9BACT|nr:FAD-binding oxidoreductase [Arsenicibacter rosenii]OIN59284.1 FAD-dependent oxidoreductase [Arsenicibacter rosenii]
MFSYWEQQTFLSGIDIAVIGSGIVGLSAAIHLKRQQPTVTVAIFERGMLPSGASTKNAGFACFGSISELLMDLETHTEAAVMALVAKRWQGLQRLKANVGTAALRFEPVGGYELFDDAAFYARCADRISYFNALLRDEIGPDVYRPADTDIARFGFRHVNHLIFNQYEGHIHTGTMMAALLEKAQTLGICVFNGALIEAVETVSQGVQLVTASGIIHCRKALVATNAFARQLLPALDVTPGRGQVLVTKPVPNLPLKGTFHMDQGYVYFRDIDGRVLLGGGRHLDIAGETTTAFGLSETIQQRLLSLLDEVILPDQPYEIDLRWSGIMGFGKQQTPIVRQVTEHVVCAVKMQGMGVALGSLTGEEGADLLLRQ